MLSKETEQKLVQLFITISIGEEKISKLKQNILANISINPIKVFYKLDTNNVGYLSRDDISSFLNYFSVNYFQNDIDYIFYFYDKDNDNVLSFYEFLDFIIPNSNYLYKKAYKKKYKYQKFDINEINEDIDANIEKCILEIFIEEINLARNLNDLILNIKQYKDFMIQDVFYEIKSYSYITNDSLKAFFDRNEINYNDKFIKNIFTRFDNKEINGKISFNKFKNFFDLPYSNKNIKNNNKFIGNNNKFVDSNNTFIDNNNHYIDNNNTQTINQTYVSDIKLNNSNTNSNYQYSSINQQNTNNNNYNDDENNYRIINNDNYINEEDIQFQCSHLSRSGSIESKKDKNENCKYITNHNRNKNSIYRNYLREKRSKSLEKSLSKSLSRGSEKISKTDKRLKNKKMNNIRNINPAYDDYNDYNNYEYNNNEYNSNEYNNDEYNNDEYNNNEYIYNDSFNGGYNNMNKSGSSFHEDLPVKMPVRLNKTLVKRPLPERKNRNLNNFNFCYNNHFEDINTSNNQMNNNSIENEEYYPQDNYQYNHYHNHNRNYSEFYNNQNRINFEKEMENSYNDEFPFQQGNNDSERLFSNNLDLKLYEEEDISSRKNNGRF